MEKATIIGIDLAKRVFQVHAASKDGRPILRKKVSRAQLLGFLAKQPPRHRGDGSVRDGARVGTGDQRSRARRAARSTDLRQAVCASAEERRR